LVFTSIVIADNYVNIRSTVAEWLSQYVALPRMILVSAHVVKCLEITTHLYCGTFGRALSLYPF